MIQSSWKNVTTFRVGLKTVYPQRWNVTTSTVWLESGHICKNLTQNGEAQSYSWVRQKKKKTVMHAKISWIQWPSQVLAGECRQWRRKKQVQWRLLTSATIQMCQLISAMWDVHDLLNNYSVSTQNSIDQEILLIVHWILSIYTVSVETNKFLPLHAWMPNISWE